MQRYGAQRARLAELIEAHDAGVQHEQPHLPEQTTGFQVDAYGFMTSVKYIPPYDSEYPGYLRLPPHTNGYPE